LTIGITSTRALAVFVRRWFASRTIVVDSVGTAIAANTPAVVTATNLGDEAALLITNASGADATVIAQMIARS
jgi:chemotaxis protein histidine kinase CheA